MPIIIPPRRGSSPPAVAEADGGRQKIVIPPRGSPRPAPGPKRPVVLPRKVLAASAFAATGLIPKRGDILDVEAKNATVGWVGPIPGAVSSGITVDLPALLKQHPLPLTPMGKVFTLHEWQSEDIATLAGFDRAGAFLPVGSGKTVIATLVALAWNDDIRVVILPPILIAQWVSWLNAVGNTGGAVAYKGTPKQRMAIPLGEYRWWVMSQQIFKNDFSHLVKARGEGTSATIVDEAQAIKNTGSQMYKQVNAFSAGQRLLLATGTELNSPGDAYAYIKLKTPSAYRSYKQFENIHVAKRDFFDKPISWQNLDLMNSNLYLQSVQRTKEEVHAHLPEAKYIPFLYDLAPAHQALYERLMDEQILETVEGGKIDGTSQVNLYNLSQQIVLGWANFTDDPTVRPAGLDVLDQVIEWVGLGKVGASKLIVWTWFKQSTKMVGAYLETLYPGRVTLAYSDSNSVKEVERFMTDPEAWFLVAQPLSAGAGLNPQYICWASLFLETPYRTIPFRQAAGRIDREGQQFNANIWIGVAENTIQTTLYNNLLANDALVQKVQGNPKDLKNILMGQT